MARNIRWQVTFKSLNGTTCRVNIYDNDWPAGVIMQVRGAADPFFYEEESSSDLLNDVLRYRTGYIRLVEMTVGAFDNIYPTSTFDRYVEFYYGNRLEFNGYIQVQDFSNTLVPAPRVIEFPVISPLGLWDKLKFSTIMPPTTVTLGSLLDSILANTTYQKVTLPNITNADLGKKVFSLVVSPWNNNFHYSDNVSPLTKVMEPESRAFLIEAICKAFGWLCHDTPNALVFTSFDYKSKYVYYEVGHIGQSGYRQNETTSEELTTLSTYYQLADDGAKQSTILPDTGIEVSYQGKQGGSFDFERCVYDSIVTMPGMTVDDGEAWSLCNLFPVGVINEVTQVSTATFEQDGKVTIGQFVVAWNGHVGVLCSIGGDTPLGHTLFTIKFYDRKRSSQTWNYSYEGMMSEYSIGALEDSDLVVNGYIKTEKVVHDDYVELIFKYNGGASNFSPLPAHTLIFIHNIKFEQLEDNLPYVEYRYPPAEESDALPSSSAHPVISSSVDMPISLYRLNDHMIGESVLSTKLTEYPYLFDKRLVVDGKFRATSSAVPDLFHTMLWGYESKTWRIISQSFHPWDDEYRLSLQHSDVLDAVITYYTITTNAANTSLDGYYDTVRSGTGFRTLVSAAIGYTIASVTITMGGVDITSTAYNSTTQQIEIQSVTGNVVITAVADTLYDAEVEYLQSNGNQYIDTGILPSKTLSFKCKFSTTSVASPGYGNVFGCRYASSQDEYQLSRYSSGSVSVGTRNSSLGFGDNTVHIVEFNGMESVNVDGITKSITTSAMPDDLGTIVMFAIRQNGSVTQKQAGKIYYCKFGQVRDFIPVRKGNVGYMYDKISGKLFGNSGTGSFSYGNDITP